MMKTVVITGSEGFIGRNLRARLLDRTDIQVIAIDIQSSDEELSAAIEQADFVVHLAGINRPKNECEFETGNKGYTQEIVDRLLKRGEKVPVLLSSSIQAANDTPYGKSKLGAELAVKDYANKTGSSVYIFRLPNVFGKWCKPDYNSVVATWCHNTARGLPIKINDPETTLALVYIDDVAEAFINALDESIQPLPDGFCVIARTYSKRLSELATAMSDFASSRNSLVMPNLETEFVRRLYGTWLSYLPENEFSYSLDTKKDDRGWLAEFIKSPSFGQVFVSKTKPGITRGNHWHHTKVEKFLVVSGRAMIRFRKIDGMEILEYLVSGDEPRVVDIPVGYTHSITNTGECDLVTLFWADEIFDSEKPDTYFREV